MKFKLIQLFKFLSKVTLYGFLIQCATFSLLLATDMNAQKYKSVKEVEVLTEAGEMTVNELFEAIQNQTSFRFSYDKKTLKRSSKININERNQTVAQLLLKVSEDFDVQFRQVNNVINVKKKESEQEEELIQIIIEDISVSGKVTDGDGNPLPGASVTIKGEIGKGTITDIDGNFKLTATDNATLIFSFIGYGTAEIDINKRSTIDVQLFEDLTTLQEVVVVGYGTVEKKDLTGSVASIEAEDLMEVPSPTIDQSLVGKLAGVHVTAASGKPGEGSRVYVRGMSQIRGDNQPLYVVDGVPVIVNPNYGDVVGDFATRENPLLMINPNDVERIDVLKDASGAAIYGSRAANGVILITTKRGKAGQAPRVTFNMNATLQNPINKYNFLNASEWRTYMTERAQIEQDGLPDFIKPFYQPSYDIINDADNFFGNEDTDWQGKITNKNALWMDYNVGLTGGTDRFQYSTAINASDITGVMVGNKFKRYGFRTNLDGQVGDRVRIGTTLNYNYSDNSASGIGNLGVANFRPDVGEYDADGNITTVPAYGSLIKRNPLHGARHVSNNSVSKNLMASAYGQVDIIDGLSFRSDVSVGVSDDVTNAFSPSFSIDAQFNLFYGRPADASLAVSANTTRTTVFSNRFIYNKLINDVHSIDATVGYEWNGYYTQLRNTTYSGFPDDFVLTSINNANDVTEWGSQNLEHGLNSLFGRVNYRYDNRYLATVTVRRDGSNKFGPNNQHGLFPSAAVAWNAHNEDFLRGIEMISMLKLRASAGRTGSDNLPAFSYLAYISNLQNGDSFYDNINGLAPLGIPNENIKWETTDQLDLGLEFGLWNDRLTAEVVYFTKKTSDIILSMPIAYETGAQDFDANIGDVSNKGWEILFGGDIVRTDDIRWNSSLNVSFIKNEVTALNGGSQLSGGFSSGIIEGYAIGTHFGYNVMSIAQSQEEIDALNEGAPDGNYFSGLTAPGDYIYEDVNGDGEITNDDRKALGDINPDYFGGWNNRVSYKNLELTFNIQFAQGKEMMWDEMAMYTSGRPSYDNVTDVVFDTWTPERTDATYARLGSTTGAYPTNSRSIHDASYIRLRTVGLAYNLPKSLLKDSFNNVRVFINANNLWTSTSYPGLDPESVGRTRGGASGTSDMMRDSGNYPLSKSFTFGLNVGF